MPRRDRATRRPTPRHRRRTAAMVDAGSEGRAAEQERKTRRKWHRFHNRTREQRQSVAAELAALAEQAANTNDRWQRRRIDDRIMRLTTPPTRPNSNSTTS
jgi:hypothetical protein